MGAHLDDFETGLLQQPTQTIARVAEVVMRRLMGFPVLRRSHQQRRAASQHASDFGQRARGFGQVL